MSALITAPDVEHVEKLFAEDLTCRAIYGTVVCGAPAQWKIIMACCGGSDFLCQECFADMSTSTPKPRMRKGKLFVPTPERAPDGSQGYFGCSLCLKLHPTWDAAVKESVRI